jgi:hypothetical protein
MKIKLLATALATSVLLGGAAHATVLFNTGYAANGAEIPLGTTAADAHWTVTGDGTGISGPTTYASLTNGSFPTPYWVNDNSVSRWITPTTVVGASFDPSVNGVYSFSQNFNLSSLTGAGFSGQFAADNIVEDIKVNGVTIYSATPGNPSSGPNNDGGWTAFSDLNGAGLQVGGNTVTFDVVNYAQNGGNPTGLDVQFAAVPEPATWAMMLMGLGGLGLALRSRRKLAGLATA